MLNQLGQPFPETNKLAKRVTCQKPLQREVEEDDENEAKNLTKFQEDQTIGRASGSQAQSVYHDEQSVMLHIQRYKRTRRNL